MNLIGTLRLLEGVKRAGIAPRLVYASSGDVYGRVPEAEMPVSEERIPLPRNPYAVSKVAAEALCGQWCRTEGLETIVARPFNHIGAGQSDAFAIPAFARQIAEIAAGLREPVLSVGDIDVTRDFLHVSDVIEAYLVLLARGQAGRDLQHRFRAGPAGARPHRPAARTRRGSRRDPRRPGPLPPFRAKVREGRKC